MKLVVNGAGAAAIACTRLYMALGVKHDNIVMCDSKGVIRADRKGLAGACTRWPMPSWAPMCSWACPWPT